jgi:hypothetical protein
MRTVPSASCRCHDLRLRAHQWRLSALDPFPEAFKQRCGTYFYYNRAAIGLACAQATAMRIDIA